MTHAELADSDDYCALIRGVCWRPDDDVPRYAISDWLEENGHGDRAELIREKIELERHPPDSPGREGVQVRIRLLLGDAPPGDYRPKMWEWFARDLIAAGCHYPIVTRGFVSEVTLAQVAFVGGVCRFCDGGYVRAGPDSRGCRTCGGTGRVPGLAAALFSRHPVTAVTLSDQHPFDAPGHPASYDWVLGRANNPATSLDRPHVLPEELFRRLPTPDADWGGRHAAYFDADGSGRSRAIAALSAAAVSYGRELAGLPPLSPAPERPS